MKWDNVIFVIESGLDRQLSERYKKKCGTGNQDAE